MNITAPESMVKLSGVPSMVRRAAFATDPNNSNMPLLRCVNLRLTSDGLRAVGSDGVCIVSAKGDKAMYRRSDVFLSPLPTWKSWPSFARKRIHFPLA